MSRHTEVGKALERYEWMIDRLAQMQASWQDVDDEIVNTFRRDTWRLCVRLWNRRLWYYARFSDSTQQRCVALRRYARVGPEEALPAINQIISDSDLPAGVVSAAKEAAQRVEMRYEIHLMERFTERVEELLHGPALENYGGYVCARVTDADGESLKVRKADELRAGSGQSCQLEVWLQARQPRRRLAEPVSIRDGRDAKKVTFEISINSDSVKFKPQRRNVTVAGDKRSTPAQFSLTMPKKAGQHKIWIELYQKEQIIQTLCVTFALDAK